MSYQLKEVTVIGTGIMGLGIVQVFSQKTKCKVNMLSRKQESLENAMKKIENTLDKLEKKGRLEESKEDIIARINPVIDIEEAFSNTDLVIESVIERIDVKEKNFKNADRFSPPNAILATNTSSFSITQIASFTQRPEKVVGMHFFNPAPI
ncbi:3-hydroxyacyl-CoA dehydrogenase, partial [Thermococci archaeon]